jgi:hypothetical protein
MNGSTTPARSARQRRFGWMATGWGQIALVIAIAIVVAVVVPKIAPLGVPAGALGNALGLVDFERTFGLFFEISVQRAALEWTPFVVAMNWWYCIAHFVVTAGVFVWLFRKHRADYPMWRNALAISAVLTLAVQAVWPLTPPRLLDGQGGTPLFVDTLSTFSAPWSFSASSTGGVANQYAAMPSMHIVWAVICACVLVPRAKHTWVKVAAVIYPFVTTLSITVTGNHYLVDALGAIPAVAIGYFAARWFARRTSKHPPTPAIAPDRHLVSA